MTWHHSCDDLLAESVRAQALPVVEEIAADSARLAAAGIAHAMNLGMHDFFPSKVSVALHKCCFTSPPALPAAPRTAATVRRTPRP